MSRRRTCGPRWRRPLSRRLPLFPRPGRTRLCGRPGRGHSCRRAPRPGGRSRCRQTAARTPLNLLAATQAPTPLPQTMMPRPALPWVTARATLAAKSGSLRRCRRWRAEVLDLMAKGFKMAGKGLFQGKPGMVAGDGNFHIILPKFISQILSFWSGLFLIRGNDAGGCNWVLPGSVFFAFPRPPAGRKDRPRHPPTLIPSRC